MPSVWHGRNRVETARSPFSVCAPSLPCCVGVLSVALCLCPCLYLVSVSVFLHVLIVTRRTDPSTGTGRAGRAAARCWGGWELLDRTQRTERDTHAQTAHACFPVPGPSACRDGRADGLRPPGEGGGGIGGGASRDSRLGCGGVEFFRLLLVSLALRLVACIWPCSLSALGPAA